MARIAKARTPEELELGRQMWREWARMIEDPAWLPGIEADLAELDRRYVPPAGVFLLALEGQEGVGCGALRRVDDDTCEMQRVFVRPEFRGRGLARTLSVSLLGEARAMGYALVRFAIPAAFVAKMAGGIKLYESLGFRPVPAWTGQPAGAFCMEARVRSGPRR